MTYVVDASVAVKWFVEEPGSSSACALLATGKVLLAPSLVLAEAGNTAWKKVRRGEMTQEQGEAMVRALPLYFHRLVHTEVLIDRAYALAHQLDHPVYDCLYLALAEQETVLLVTDDRRLLKVVARTEFHKRVRSLEHSAR